MRDWRTNRRTGRKFPRAGIPSLPGDMEDDEFVTDAEHYRRLGVSHNDDQGLRMYDSHARLTTDVRLAQSIFALGEKVKMRSGRIVEVIGMAEHPYFGWTYRVKVPGQTRTRYLEERELAWT